MDSTELDVAENILWIADNDRSAALKILTLPFLETLEPGDGATVESFAHLLAHVQGNPLSIFDALVEMSWVTDGFDETELELVSKIWSFTDNDESVALAFLTKSWIADGFNGVEAEILEDIRRIADNDESAALRILDMPFLDVVQTSDRYVVSGFKRLARHSSDHFLRLMEHPLVRDGISDRTARIIPMLPHFVNTDEPDWDLVDTLLKPNNNLLEEQTITLPLAGEVDLAIIRITPGSPRNMGYLEHAVRVNEEFMDVPFPTDYVAVLFADDPETGTGGRNYASHIIAGPLHDNGGDDYVTTYSHGLLAHETAHYYWRGGQDWMYEGAASFMTEIAQIARIGRPWRDHFVLCGYARSIAELESLSPPQGERAFSCNYSLGERLFMDLYRELGDTEFRRSFRALYMLSKTHSDECEGTGLNICRLRAAFIHQASEESAAIAEKVIARWYDGTEPYAAIEVIAPDPLIPSIGGRVNTFMSARYGGTPIEGPLSESEKMPTDDHHPHLLLSLNYNYPPRDPTREVEFKVLSYFEDGFAFHSNTASFMLKSGHQGVSSQWISVGLAPDEPWPIGRYWISVYLDDVKVGEETFEIVR